MLKEPPRTADEDGEDAVDMNGMDLEAYLMNSTIADDTANYSNYYVGAPGDGGADTTYNYLGGNDVVYSYSATSDTSINVSMSPDTTYAGIFAYDSCENIGVQCYAAALNGNSADNLSFDMNVFAEMTYYIVISTWPSPYTVGYDLVITENTCSDPVVTATASSCEGDESLTRSHFGF